MQNGLLTKAEQYQKKHKRRKVWHKIVSVLACVVVFCTVYVLILPAITMEDKVYCGIEEHRHTDDCYETKLICEYDEPLEQTGSEETVHEHTNDCYESILLCSENEHQHSLACYSNPKADLESTSVWEQSVAGVELTGIWEDDVVAIAESQLGYCESINNYQVMEDGKTIKGVTRYGQWYGDAYEDWCAMFVSFCLNYAEIPETTLPYEADCQRWIELLSKSDRDLYRTVNTYKPKKGDLVFFDRDADGCADTVGLISHVDEEKLTVIEGNSSNCVRANEYSVGDIGIMGYGILPENPESPLPEETTDTNGQTWTATIYTDNTYQTLSKDTTKILVTGELPKDAKVLASPISVETEMQSLCAYDIVIRLSDGSRFVPEETMPVTVSVQSSAFSELEENRELQVYQIAGSEEPKRVDAKITDNAVSFPFNGTAAYMVVASLRDANAPEATTEITLADDFLYENKQFSMVLHVEGNAYLQNGVLEATDGLLSTPPQDTMTTLDTTEDVSSTESAEETPVLVVTEVDTQQPSYQQISSNLTEEFSDDLLDLSVLSLEFYYQGVLLDISSCEITAQIVPQTQMMDTAQAACAALDAAPEAETGVVFTVVGTTEDGTEELDSTVVSTSSWETPVLTASVDSNGVLAVAAALTANPKFTVQYYAWLDVVADQGDKNASLPVIDTSGRVLPQNGVTPTEKALYLEETKSGSGIYGIKTESVLTQIYKDYDYQYITAPNLTYFNRLYKNGYYKIKAIWILKEGRDAASVDQNDWNVYNPEKTHFTNRSQSVNENTVLITEGTVIRLVFDTTESTHTNSVNFYDYDITDDGTHTNAHGINSASNYSGSGSKLAFGNANTDTGLSDFTWNGNKLNQENSNGYSGCTFGLVTDLIDGMLHYAKGVDAPKLFNDGDAKGKTSYDQGQYSLSFDRIGDTYTLSSVGGTSSAKNLQTFTGRDNWNHTRQIWSNHFWPMDNVKNTDPHTGATGNTGSYIGQSGETKNYPPSDNDVAHNNMFGMTYQVQFTMNEDYVGPLEYYFFGDDDMWVFLDGKLVCDIGGVHSSVGEYVDLWDYIEKGSSGTHTLSFFYTERGLSGSTCYMQFTLPSVSSVTPSQNTGLLTVQKLVEGKDSDEEFHFDIMLTDENGNPLPDDYSYTRYAADGTVIKQDVIIYDGGSFDLKAGEYVIINYLPYGTKYTITEQDAPCYVESYQIDGGSSVEGYVAQGQIPPGGGNSSVVYTNTAIPELPATGGMGTLPYLAGGTLLFTAALFLLYQDRKRHI